MSKDRVARAQFTCDCVCVFLPGSPSLHRGIAIAAKRGLAIACLFACIGGLQERSVTHHYTCISIYFVLDPVDVEVRDNDLRENGVFRDSKKCCISTQGHITTSTGG